MVNKRVMTTVALCGGLAIGAGGCGEEEAAGGGTGELRGSIRIDGSSTVYPFAQAAAESFMARNPGVRIAVGQSGTGGGFEKFCAGETDVSNASRPIKPDEEVPLCEEGGVEYAQVQVANDGIAVVSNKALPIDCLTTGQLEELWATPRVKRYAEIDPELPDRQVSLFGPGTDSGTFDFFTGEVNGDEGRTRKDYQPSEDDNVLVQGVQGDEGGLGYFGFSYYEQNRDELNLIAVDAGDGCVEPSRESIQDGSYEPLSRPLFMYPSAKAIRRPEVRAFLDHVERRHAQIAADAQLVAMTAEQARRARQALTEAER
ncbi:MAG TPA: PstS family phosphate ABC transporter substrate-binding protein [Solirubrobacteraceae bacterium]|jgi:phosphate transport system substrate-binding protein|nr:PstS family phosphate ABC transporter substrate-binding protein [Solirubrobacteraceae bacterium]